MNVSVHQRAVYLVSVSTPCLYHSLMITIPMGPDSLHHYKSTIHAVKLLNSITGL